MSNAAIVPQPVFVLDNDSDDEDRITLIPSGDEQGLFVPSDNGETCAIFLTDDERNFLARTLVVHSLKSEVEKGLCRSIILKLPRRKVR
jgi:hypothetical protein